MEIKSTISNLSSVFGTMRVGNKLPIGKHEGTFKNVQLITNPLRLVITFDCNGTIFEQSRKLETDGQKKSASHLINDIAKQLGYAPGQEYNPDKLVEHAGQPLTVWSYLPEGFESPEYRYSEAKVNTAATTENASELTASDF